MSIENKMLYKTIKGVIPSNEITIIMIAAKWQWATGPTAPSLSHSCMLSDTHRHTHDCNMNNIVHCVLFPLFIVHSQLYSSSNNKKLEQYWRWMPVVLHAIYMDILWYSHYLHGLPITGRLMNKQSFCLYNVHNSAFLLLLPLLILLHPSRMEYSMQRASRNL